MSYKSSFVILILTAMTCGGDLSVTEELVDLANSGNANAQFRIAQAYADSGSSGLQQNHQLAAYWMRRAAENNHSEAQATWGIVLLRGDWGMAVDYRAAFHWLVSAADKEQPKALYGLGFMYLNGLGIEPDNETAFALYHRAAELGSLEAREKIRESARNRTTFQRVLTPVDPGVARNLDSYFPHTSLPLIPGIILQNVSEFIEEHPYWSGFMLSLLTLIAWDNNVRKRFRNRPDQRL